MKLRDVGYLKFLGLFLLILLVTGCAGAQRAEIAGPEPEPSPRIVEAAPEEMEELLITQTEPEKSLPPREESGKLLSLSLRDAEIREVLLALAKKSDLNIIVDPDVSGMVTVDLKRVTFKEALDALLAPLGLEYRKEGRFIRVLKPQMETRLFTLNYMAIHSCPN